MDTNAAPPAADFTQGLVATSSLTAGPAIVGAAATPLEHDSVAVDPTASPHVVADKGAASSDRADQHATSRRDLSKGGLKDLQKAVKSWDWKTSVDAVFRLGAPCAEVRSFTLCRLRSNLCELVQPCRQTCLCSSQRTMGGVSLYL